MTEHTPPLLGPLGGPHTQPAGSPGSSGPMGQALPMFRALFLAAGGTWHSCIPRAQTAAHLSALGPLPCPQCPGRSVSREGAAGRASPSAGTAGVGTDSSTADGTAPRPVGRSCVGTAPTAHPAPRPPV